MRIAAAFVGVLVLGLVLSPTAASGGENAVFSGQIGVAGKYESNVDLGSGKGVAVDENDEIEDAYITEFTARLAYQSPWTSPWHLDAELYALADLFVENVDDTWGLGRAQLYVGRNFGDNTISVLDQVRYYTEPDDTELDNVRNSASLAYKRIFSPLWQSRIGYENIVHHFPESRFFDYVAHAGFLELRNTWSPAFSTYYSYSFQYYRGSYNSNTDDPLSSPEAGYRHTGEIGFESFFARKNSLLGAYTFQADDSSGQGVEQIGNFRGEEETLEVDAEFNYLKHKGMLLYSHRFSDALSLALYDELIHKTFIERDAVLSIDNRDRTDVLFLSSVWFTARLYKNLFGRARYLFRMNQSTVDFEDFQDHIGILGLEQRF